MTMALAEAFEAGRATGETLPLLLAAAGQESSDAAPTWKHGATDGGAASASGVSERCCSKEVGQRGGEGRKGVGGIR